MGTKKKSEPVTGFLKHDLQVAITKWKQSSISAGVSMNILKNYYDC